MPLVPQLTAKLIFFARSGTMYSPPPVFGKSDSSINGSGQDGAIAGMLDDELSVHEGFCVQEPEDKVDLIGRKENLAPQVAPNLSPGRNWPRSESLYRISVLFHHMP